jgi:intracellular septation protein
MDSTTLLLGVLPLVAFVVVDAFAGLKAGLAAAVIFAVLEVVYSFAFFGYLDEISLGSLVLIAGFSFVSYRTNKPIYFKLQPVALGVVFALIFLVMQWLDKPLLVMMIQKYQYVLPDNVKEMVTNPSYLILLEKISGLLGYGFLIHSALIAYSVFYLSNLWWILIRGIGIYIMMIACSILAQMT